MLLHNVYYKKFYFEKNIAVSTVFSILYTCNKLRNKVFITYKLLDYKKTITNYIYLKKIEIKSLSILTTVNLIK